MQETFERSLDLFLGVRRSNPHIKKPHIEPSQLLPKLPKPESLKPYPTHQAVQFIGHEGRVRSLHIHGEGNLLISGGDDGIARIWEINTGRCLKTFNLGGVINCVQWNPNLPLFPGIFAIAVDSKLLIVDCGLFEPLNKERMEEFFSAEIPEAEEGKTFALWEKGKGDILLQISHERTIKHLSWHPKGDYIIATSPDASSNTRALLIHQISKKKSQNPFKKQKSKIQAAQFHPTKPQLFLATQLHIKIYDLAHLKLEKRLQPGVQWISSFSIHPGGDNLILSSYDKKVCWMDLDLSVRPYKILSYHTQAVRKTIFHPKFPLFASCSDDTKIHIFHGMVYNDLAQNALVVPLKVLQGHDQVDELGILDIAFHPEQPWIVSCGADSTIKLWI